MYDVQVFGKMKWINPTTGIELPSDGTDKKVLCGSAKMLTR